MDGVYAIYLSLFWEYRLFKGQIIVQFILYFIFLVFIYFIIAQNKHVYLWTKVKLQKRERDKDTLCYFTPRADGSHTPQCLLEGCIHMETAITIGQVLQETDVSHVWTIYWCTTLKYIQTVFPNQKHQLDSRKSKSVLMHKIMWLFRYFHSTGLHKSTERTKDCVIYWHLWLDFSWHVQIGWDVTDFCWEFLSAALLEIYFFRK